MFEKSKLIKFYFAVNLSLRDTIELYPVATTGLNLSIYCLCPSGDICSHSAVILAN